MASTAGRRSHEMAGVCGSRLTCAIKTRPSWTNPYCPGVHPYAAALSRYTTGWDLDRLSTRRPEGSWFCGPELMKG